MNAPFQYGTLATKENFIDRVEDRAQLKNFLSSHINVMLVSPRRWGKSSLVKVAMEGSTGGQTPCEQGWGLFLPFTANGC